MLRGLSNMQVANSKMIVRHCKNSIVRNIVNARDLTSLLGDDRLLIANQEAMVLIDGIRVTNWRLRERMVHPLLVITAALEKGDLVINEALIDELQEEVFDDMIYINHEHMAGLTDHDLRVVIHLKDLREGLINARGR